VFVEVGSNYLSEQELGFKTQEFYQNLDSMATDALPEIRTETVEQYELVDSFTYYTAAMLCMFMLFSAGIGGRSMLEEKENITYHRMKVLGVTYFQMMISKMIVVLIICLLQSAVMISLSSIFFGVDWGNYLSVIIIALCGSFAIGGLGSFIGAISLRSGNYKLANAFEGALVQVLALLGGSYIPLSVLPKFFTKISKFTVNGQALSAYLKTAQGMAIGNITSEIFMILLFGALFFGAAWLLVSSEGRKENA
jgi:ABC-2 type transport system permease protein